MASLPPAGHKTVISKPKTRPCATLFPAERDGRPDRGARLCAANSNVIFEPDGTYRVHRKLKPTGSERVVWGDADKGYFPVTQTPWGPIGALICWESYMPLARVALYQKGVTIYISPNTNDNPEWQATIQHIAIEGKCYFVNADMIVGKELLPL